MTKTKPSTPQTSNSPSINKIISLQHIFHDHPSLGWQILDAESKIYTQMQVNMEKITYLTELYMRIIEKLNSIQDQRQHYFTFKMQKLMSEPYIIRFFNNQSDCKKNTRDDRRKKLQQKIEKEAERQNHKVVVEETLRAHEEKQKRMMKKIKDFLDQSDKSIELRIKKRNQIRQYRNSVLSPKRATSQIEDNESKIVMQSTTDKTSESERSRSRLQLNSNHSPTSGEQQRQFQKQQSSDKPSRIIFSESKPKLGNKNG